MTDARRVRIERLPTGVPGLDQVLGGGLPEYSFNLIAGTPGTGKTTLAQQIMFANATEERPALYFTVLGEPPIKMLRYQQQMGFFDLDKVDRIVHFANLSEEVVRKDLSKVLATIMQVVERLNPGIVVVDSFRTVARVMAPRAVEMNLQTFLQRLALFLTSWQATTFMVGEYSESELRDNPVFTVTDAILWLYQSVERNSIVRKLQVMKIRGQEPMPGLHTFRITQNGLQVFPRIPAGMQRVARAVPRRRLSTGVSGLDQMMDGGIPSGDSVLVAGPSGSGKSTLAAQFISEGVRQGEPGVIAVFEEFPEEYLMRARGFGIDLAEMVRQGKARIVYLRPLDLSVDETLQAIRNAAGQIGAQRVVIDSVSGFELALAPTFRLDFRESLYRLVGSLTGGGITVLMTVEVVETFRDLRFSPHMISFLTDDIILQRYIEMDGGLRHVVTVVKMRSSSHSKAFKLYELTGHGVVVGEDLEEYRGIITGVPERRETPLRPVYPGLTDQETRVLEVLAGMREGTANTIAIKTDLPHAELARALDRLVALNYAVKVVEKGRTMYRPVSRALGL